MPAGRQLLTLVLLTVCVARGQFRRISYDDKAENLIANAEYELAEEVLMPAAEARRWTISTLADVRNLADVCAVTPSAVLMRAFRDQSGDQIARLLPGPLLRRRGGRAAGRPRGLLCWPDPDFWHPP